MRSIAASSGLGDKPLKLIKDALHVAQDKGLEIPPGLQAIATKLIGKA